MDSKFPQFLSLIANFFNFFRFLPYLIPASEDGESGVDLSTLRTFRVLRPLKLVSGVPSKQNSFFSFDRVQCFKYKQSHEKVKVKMQNGEPKIENVRLFVHSVEISRFFYNSDFT